jgi:methyltransferase
MAIGSRTYLALIAALAGERLFELWLSRRNGRAAARAGAIEVRQPHTRAIVLFHAAFIFSCIFELLLFHPAAPAAIEDAALGVALLAEAVRYWAVLTLGERWNARIVVWPDRLPVTSGPYRFLRHPNYVAIVLEMAAIPMIHGCLRTAIAFSLGNAMLLAIRIPAEERALGEGYRAAFADKPRFLRLSPWRRRP